MINLHFLNSKWNWSPLLYLYLLAFCISSFMKCLFKFFPNFSIWFHTFYLSMCRTSLYILDMSILLHTHKYMYNKKHWKSWLSKRTWKGLLQILAQASKNNRSLKLRILKLIPCKLSCPHISWKVFMHSQVYIYLSLKNVGLEYIKLVFIFPAFWDKIDIQHHINVRCIT